MTEQLCLGLEKHALASPVWEPSPDIPGLSADGASVGAIVRGRGIRVAVHVHVHM